MQALKVLIVEDERIIAYDIAAQLRDLGLDPVKILGSAEEAMVFLKNTTVDLVLLDVALEGALDGIDLAGFINREVNIPFIYMTSNTDDLTFERAKSTLPFAFIEKPFKRRQLVRSVELLVEKLLSEPDRGSSFVLKDRIFLKDQNALVKINLEGINYLEADRAYCKIVTDEGNYVVSLALGSIESKLDLDIFVRVHRSYVVNLLKIDRIEDNHVHVKGRSIPVSKTYWPVLVQRLNIL